MVRAGKELQAPMEESRRLQEVQAGWVGKLRGSMVGCRKLVGSGLGRREHDGSLLRNMIPGLGGQGRIRGPKELSSSRLGRREIRLSR